jgi:predicted nucleic acid-binding protein
MPVRLVIDASVPIAAGESNHPISSLSRQFLDEAINGDHILVLTKEIEQEWKNTEKPRAYFWLRRFYAKGKRKYLWLGDDCKDADLRDALDQAAYSDKARIAMLEDVHLLEASLATDYNVISLDQTVRKIFVKVTLQVEKIQEIVWVNPGDSDENGMTWLQSGCPAEHSRQLGYRTEDESS